MEPSGYGPTMSGPLSGVRVLDLTTVVAGPYATMLLGDLGADVIKIEPPEGDSMRPAGQHRTPGMGSIFLTVGRNKRSVALDLKLPGAQAALAALVRDADVLVHNVRPDAAARLGIDDASLRPLNDRLIHATVLGFGEGGPYSGQPAYDDIVQALAGPVGLMEHVGGEPRYVPMIFVDKTTGLSLSTVVCAALFHRERSGTGQAVTVPMFETMVSFAMVEHLFDATFAAPAGDQSDQGGSTGYVRVLSPNRRPYPTADGFVCALPYLDKHFKKFFALAGRPELFDKPQFHTLAARIANIDEVYATVAELMPARTTAEWLADLQAAEIPAARVNRLEDLLSDPHLEAVGFWRRIDHPSEGWIRQPAVPWTFTASPPELRRTAPRVGEHTVEVLAEAGVDTAEIDRLLATGGAVQDSWVRRQTTGS